MTYVVIWQSKNLCALHYHWHVVGDAIGVDAKDSQCIIDLAHLLDRFGYQTEQREDALWDHVNQAGNATQVVVRVQPWEERVAKLKNQYGKKPNGVAILSAQWMQYNKLIEARLQRAETRLQEMKIHLQIVEETTQRWAKM